ncbi:Autophagy-related protein [Wickerhamomyces ciferrii]|uniref:Autophagy-related protein 17 n=1 Tax=Wickerhamomyces ciferrii (strain ATCC 14091 / BCRC 22168 / CBS 111 / JCM 3599 / NBRC 0793 / NRRL Y-1031 F-60-10) TaxID=1206466 RepID=K0KE07_WICCF|nr:Autophagy-related protein [Wickerhamomyces ciferrii]CCH40477.1 Autophagy-related protein [Wickerhamomyces ciferrii]
MNKSTIQQWVNDATTTLSQAQSIGNNANTYLNNTKSILSQNNIVLNNSNFILDSSIQLLNLLKLITNSIELKQDDLENDIQLLENELNNNISFLNNEFKKLSHIKIDSNLLHDTTTTPTLYDFISNNIQDSLSILQQKLTHATHKTQISTQTKKLTTTLSNFNDSFNNLDSIFNKINDENSTLISNLIHENNLIESDIAISLESITNHYDQCNKALGLIDSNEDHQDFFKVLENDSIEVFEVLNDLNGLFDDLKENCNKINGFYQNLKGNYDKLINFIKDITQFQIELEKKLELIESIIWDFKELENDIKTKCKESEIFIQYINQYTQAYYKLILEINRQNQSQTYINNIIMETQKKLKNLQNDDYQKKQEFNREYNKFLPLELRLQGIDKPLYDLQFELQDIMKLSESSVLNARQKLEK